MRTSLSLFLLPTIISGLSSAVNVASTFKASSSNTPIEIIESWKKQDDALFAYVKSKVPAVLEHTGESAFDEHLSGVQAVLRSWKAPDYVAKAGLFHSIYGSEGFQGFCLPLSERPVLQDLIGPKAEFLVWVFCMVDRYTVDEHVMKWKAGQPLQSMYTVKSRAEFGRFEMQLNTEEFLDFVELVLADWLEQVEGASLKENKYFLWKLGEAYAYRRDQYKQMSVMLAHERKERLGDIVPEMHRAVYDAEPMETRHLVQPRTPPITDAAYKAFDALRASGEDIPLDLTPQPRAGSDIKAEML